MATNAIQDSKEWGECIFCPHLLAEREQALKAFALMLGARTAWENERNQTTKTNEIASDIVLSISSLNLSLTGECPMVTTSNDKLPALLARDPVTLCIFPSLDIFSGDMQDLFSTLSSGVWLAPGRASQVEGSLATQKTCVVSEVSSSKTTPPCIPPYVENQTKADNSLDYVMALEHNIQEKGAANLSEPISWTRSSSPYAPMAMLQSFSRSFTSILESRLKACMLLLLTHSLANGQGGMSQLITFLLDSGTIGVKSIAISFEALSSSSEKYKSPKSSDATDLENQGMLVLPLHFEAFIVSTVQQESVDVKLTATGLIKGSFNNSRNALLNRVEVTLDASSLISGMVKATKIIIAKAINTFSAQTKTNAYNGGRMSDDSSSPAVTSPPVLLQQAASAMPANHPVEVPLSKPTISFASRTLISSVNERRSNRAGAEMCSAATSSRSPREKMKSLSTISYSNQNSVVVRRHSDVTNSFSLTKHTLENPTRKSSRRYSTPESKLLSSISVGKPITCLLNFSNRNATFENNGTQLNGGHNKIKRRNSHPEGKSQWNSRTDIIHEQPLRFVGSKSIGKHPARYGKQSDSCFVVPLLIRGSFSTGSIRSSTGTFDASGLNGQTKLFSNFTGRQHFSLSFESLLPRSLHGEMQKFSIS